MIIQSTRVWILDVFLPCQIEVEGTKITAIHPYGAKEADEDYGDLRIVPGFIDEHTHGAYGFDTNDANEEGLRNWLKNIPSEGITALLPTTITQSEEVLTRALENVAKVVREGYEGAEILGIHFEGPYLDKVYKGAQPEQYCIRPDLSQFERYWEASDHLLKLITLAPEHDVEFALTHFCVDHGIRVNMGHSSATFEEAALGIANGAMGMTHVFNGMSPFHHRKPGLVGAAYRFQDVYGEVICDGNHSHLAALYSFFEAKGPNFGIMITDSLMVKGLPAGTKVLFGGNLIELFPDGSAHLVEAGNLAGSTLRVNQGLKILVEKAMVPWQTAINSCTRNPAVFLGFYDRKGSIQTGKDADFVVLEDNYDVKATYGLGKKLYEA